MTGRRLRSRQACRQSGPSVRDADSLTGARELMILRVDGACLSGSILVDFPDSLVSRLGVVNVLYSLQIECNHGRRPHDELSMRLTWQISDANGLFHNVLFNMGVHVVAHKLPCKHTGHSFLGKMRSDCQRRRAKPTKAGNSGLDGIGSHGAMEKTVLFRRS